MSLELGSEGNSDASRRKLMGSRHVCEFHKIKLEKHIKPARLISTEARKTCFAK